MQDCTDINEVVRYTQSMRLRIINTLTGAVKDDGMPSTSDDLNLLNRTLDSMDKAVIARQRVMLEETSTQLQKEASKILNEVLTSFVLPKLQPVKEAVRVMDIGHTLSADEMVEGEMDVDGAPLELNDILQEF